MSLQRSWPPKTQLILIPCSEPRGLGWHIQLIKEKATEKSVSSPYAEGEEEEEEEEEEIEEEEEMTVAMAVVRVE